MSRSPATMSQAKCQFIEFDCEFGESQQNTSISVRSCASLESVEVYPVRHSNYTVTRSGTGKFILESQHLLANTDKAIVCMNVKMTMLFISRVRGAASWKMLVFSNGFLSPRSYACQNGRLRYRVTIGIIFSSGRGL